MTQPIRLKVLPPANQVYRGPSSSPDCPSCPFAVNGQAYRPVTGIGPASPDFIIMGEGPGRNEVLGGAPFLGLSGRLVDKVLKARSVDRKKLWVTNATLCIKDSATDDQKAKAVKCCAPRLHQELADMPGIPVWTLGAHSAHALRGDRFSITELAGTCEEIVLPGDEIPRQTIASFHPAHILRGGDAKGGGHTVDLEMWNLLADVEKVRLLGAKDTSVIFQNDFETVPNCDGFDADHAQRLVDQMLDEIDVQVTAWVDGGGAGELPLLYIDIETISDDPKHEANEVMHAVIHQIGLATPAFGCSVPWAAIDGTKTGDRLRDYLRYDDVRKGFHNRLFDALVLFRHGYEVKGPIEDTLLQHHSAYPGLAHKLQRVAAQFFVIRAWKAEFRDGDETPEEGAEYNAIDALAGARLVGPLHSEMKRMDAEATYRVDTRMAEIAGRMILHGIPIDWECNHELTEIFEKLAAEANQKLQDGFEPLRERFLDVLASEQAKTSRKADNDADYVMRHAIRLQELVEGKGKKVKRGMFERPSFTNDRHVAAYLKAAGVPLVQETKTGKLATGKDVLEGYARFEAVRPILDFRAATKLVGSFLRPLKHWRDDIGFIHPAWSINAITGRWKADKPSIMNWPKVKLLAIRLAKVLGYNEKQAKELAAKLNLRRQVRAPEGYRLVAFDMKGFEARVIALLSGDPYMVQLFKEGRDIHAELSREWCPNYDSDAMVNGKLQPALSKDARDAVRDQTKRTEFGCFYEGSVQELWLDIVKDYPSVTLAMIAGVVRKMKQLMPRVGQWHREMENQVVKTGELRSMLGRRRCFPLHNVDPTVIGNHPVQCLRGDQHVLTTRGWVRIDALEPSRHALVRMADRPTQSYVKHATGKRDVYRLKTQGHSLVATEGHHFLKVEGAGVTWARLDEIKAGDWVAIDRKGVSVSAVNDPKNVSEDAAELIGALFGNGYYAGRGMHIATGSEGYARHLCSVAERALGPSIRVCVRLRKDRTWQVCVDTDRLREVLISWGLVPASRRDKRLPQWFTQCSEALTQAVLRGLFDTDGGFSLGYLLYTTGVRQAAEDIQRALLTLGIDSRLRRIPGKTPAGVGRVYWRVAISPWSVAAFCQKIGFRHPTRAARLQTQKWADSRRPCPPGIAQAVAAMIIPHMKGVPRIDHSRVARVKKGKVSIDQLLRLLASVEAVADATGERVVAEARQMVTRYEYERVASVRRVAPDYTYDLSIDGDHSYIAEGLITHNSTAADIMNGNMDRLDRALAARAPTTEIIMQQHDQGVMLVPEDDVQLVREIVTETCDTVVTHNGVSVRFAIDLKDGETWAEV